MSKVGKKPIPISGTKVTVGGSTVKVAGPLGEMTVAIPDGVRLEVKENEIEVRRNSESLRIKSLHGTVARLIQNAITGVNKGFEKYLEIAGTGYRGQMEGENLLLSLGLSHQVKFPAPQGINLSVQESKIRVFGVDKEKVGVTAYKIKKLKWPDSYKGKGIRYLGEKLKFKPGKAVAKIGGAGPAK